MAFPSTHYSLLAGLAETSEPLRRDALERLVEIYWKPVYKYVRLRWRREQADAEDLTQSFFLALFERDTLARFDRGRGSFHNFLRICIDNLARDNAKAASSARRGGGQLLRPLDFSGAEAELAAVAAGAAASPEDLFQREWQRQIFVLAVADLKLLCLAQDKSTHFALFSAHDLAAAKQSYAELATALGLTVTQVTNYLHWARRQLRRLALSRLAGVTGSEAELRAQTRALFEP